MRRPEMTPFALRILKRGARRPLQQAWPQRSEATQRSVGPPKHGPNLVRVIERTAQGVHAEPPGVEDVALAARIIINRKVQAAPGIPTAGIITAPWLSSIFLLAKPPASIGTSTVALRRVRLSAISRKSSPATATRAKRSCTMA